jgi:TonB family protein
MIAGWMLYALLVSLLLGVGAHLLEAAARPGLPRRSFWVGALAGSVILPLLVRATGPLRVRTGSGGVVVGDFEVVGGAAVPPAGADHHAAAPLEQLARWAAALEPLLIWGWGATTLALLALALISVAGLRRSEREWGEAELAGTPVRVSAGVGPAVLGFVRQRIVVPAWVLTAPEAEQRMILAHEREHVRAGDHRLILGAYALLLLLPWNLPLWWMVRRLRLAVEVDCDARVLGGGADPRLYGCVLLQVGAARGGRVLGATALTEPRSYLERRIEMMTTSRAGAGRWAPLAVAGALTAIVTACAVDQPRGAIPTAPPAVEPESPASVAMALEEPRFTPYDVRPELIGAAEARALVAAHYPPMLRDAGIGGTALLWVLIDATGRVTHARLVESSGHEALDDAASAAMHRFRFTPASHQGTPVPVWIQLPVRFAPGAACCAIAGSSAGRTRTRRRSGSALEPSSGSAVGSGSVSGSGGGSGTGQRSGRCGHLPIGSPGSGCGTWRADGEERHGARCTCPRCRPGHRSGQPAGSRSAPCGRAGPRTGAPHLHPVRYQAGAHQPSGVWPPDRESLSTAAPPGGDRRHLRTLDLRRRRWSGPKHAPHAELRTRRTGCRGRRGDAAGPLRAGAKSRSGRPRVDPAPRHLLAGALNRRWGSVAPAVHLPLTFQREHRPHPGEHSDIQGSTIPGSTVTQREHRLPSSRGARSPDIQREHRPPLSRGAPSPSSRGARSPVTQREHRLPSSRRARSLVTQREHRPPSARGARSTIIQWEHDPPSSGGARSPDIQREHRLPSSRGARSPDIQREHHPRHPAGAQHHPRHPEGAQRPKDPDAAHAPPPAAAPGIHQRAAA